MNMAEPFLGEIRIMSFGILPKGWADCNGQFLPINQNQALFSLLGTTYGGNGQTTFALPNLQGRVPIHSDSAHSLGERAGEEAHTLTIAELPTHTHVANGTSNLADQITPAGNLMAVVDPVAFTTNLYGAPANLVAMAATMVASSGGSQAHLNMQPFLTLNFRIALIGIFPSQN
jgi:microcystin-dependent protein